MFLDPSHFWFFIGLIILLVELITLSVILLFVALSCMTIGVVLFLNMVDPSDTLTQSIIFFGSIVLWYLALFVPMKKIKMFKLKKGHKNILDQRAEVLVEITRKKPGKVRWSGTKMNAVLSKNNLSSVIKKKAIVRIIAIDGDVLTVTSNP